MRVLHLNTNLRWGGGENQLLQLAKTTQQGDFQSEILARRSGLLLKRAEAAKIRCEAFDYFFRYGPLAISKLAGITRQKDARILHLHDSNAISLGVPVGILNPQLKVIVHRRIASPLRKNSLTRWKYSPARVHAYIAVSESAKQSLIDFGIPSQKIHLVPSGVDFEALAELPAKETLRKELGLEEGIWIGTVTTLEAKKNSKAFIEAAARVAKEIPNAKFLVVGDGPERESLETLSRSLGVEGRFRFCGFQEQATRFMAALDVFVFPSLMEGSPGALKEAIALQIPSVIAKAPGNTEIVGADLASFVMSSDSGDYARAILEILKDVNAASERATKAAIKVRANFSMQQMVEKTLKVYQSLNA